jgi:hypothetical protein
MAEIQSGFLCNAATQDATGLVSVLGAFVDSVAAPALPIQALLNIVARIKHAEDELDRALDMKISVVRLSDGVDVVSAKGELRVERVLGGDPAEPAVSQLIVPLPVVLDKPGRHEVRLEVEGEVIWATPITANLLDGPPPQS